MEEDRMDKDPMEKEYPALRQEIVNWQNYRFVLLSASIALMSGVIGFGLKSQDTSQWWFVSSALLLIYLALAASLTCYAGRGNAKLGAYLSVFYEPVSV